MFTLFTDLSKPINTASSTNNPGTHSHVSISYCAIYIFETMSQLLCNELLCLLMFRKTQRVSVCVCVFDIINPKLWGGLKSKEGGTHQGCAVVSQLIEKTLYQSSPVHGSSQRFVSFWVYQNKTNISSTCPWAPSKTKDCAHRQTKCPVNRQRRANRAQQLTHTHTHSHVYAAHTQTSN